MYAITIAVLVSIKAWLACCIALLRASPAGSLNSGHDDDDGDDDNSGPGNGDDDGDDAESRILGAVEANYKNQAGRMFDEYLLPSQAAMIDRYIQEVDRARERVALGQVFGEEFAVPVLERLGFGAGVIDGYRRWWGCNQRVSKSRMAPWPVV